jgi:hypothetical protein
MTILQNTNTSSNGHFTGQNFGEAFSGNRLAVQDILYRDGVRRRKPKLLDETPYERIESRLVVPKGSLTQTLPGYVGSYSEEGVHSNFGALQINEASFSGFQFDTNLENRAGIKALNLLDRMDFDFGTAFAESGKTVKMVTSLAETAVKALNRVRKKDVRGFLKEVDLVWAIFKGKPGKPQRVNRGIGIVDTYLTYQYGVKPLLQDISGSVDALVRLPPEAFRISVLGKHGNSGYHLKEVGIGTRAPNWALSEYREGCRVKISAIPRISNNRIDDLNWSLGLDNFGATQAWELLPFSFVLDWAVPIGDYIRGLTTLRYYEGWQTVTSKYLKEINEFRPWMGRLTGWDIQSFYKDGVFNYLHIKRTVTGGPPMYGIPYKDPASLDHIAKALALLTSTIAHKGNPPRYMRL